MRVQLFQAYLLIWQDWPQLLQAQCSASRSSCLNQRLASKSLQINIIREGDSLLTYILVPGFEPVGLHLTVKLIFGRLGILLVIKSGFVAVVSAATLFKWLLVVPSSVTTILTNWFIFGLAKCLQIDVFGTVAHLNSLLTIFFEATLWPERSTCNSSSQS